MAKTVQILGFAPNVIKTPDVEGAERWCMNNPRGMWGHYPHVSKGWTRWFNFHSMKHQLARYPHGVKWFREKDTSRPIYLQKVDPTIPASVAYPREAVMAHFANDGIPETFFTCSCSLMLALAIMEGFERIELYGFMCKKDYEHAFERPCIAYWVGRARGAGISVYFPPGVDIVTSDKFYGWDTTPTE